MLVYHEEKEEEGRDAGDLAGIDPIGVAATREVDALAAEVGSNGGVARKP